VRPHACSPGGLRRRGGQQGRYAARLSGGARSLGQSTCPLCLTGSSGRDGALLHRLHAHGEHDRVGVIAFHGAAAHQHLHPGTERRLLFHGLPLPPARRGHAPQAHSARRGQRAAQASNTQNLAATLLSFVSNYGQKTPQAHPGSSRGRAWRRARPGRAARAARAGRPAAARRRPPGARARARRPARPRCRGTSARRTRPACGQGPRSRRPDAPCLSVHTPAGCSRTRSSHCNNKHSGAPAPRIHSERTLGAGHSRSCAQKARSAKNCCPASQRVNMP
jgi:hypothetical protein